MKFFYLQKSDATLGVIDTAPRILPVILFARKVNVDDVNARIFDALYDGHFNVVRKRQKNIDPALVKAAEKALDYLIEQGKVDFIPSK